MKEARESLLAARRIKERLRFIEEQLDLEFRQGLDADWTGLAESFENIASDARDASAGCWRVAYEGEAV